MKRFFILLVIALGMALSATTAEARTKKLEGSGRIVEHHKIFAEGNSALADCQGIVASRGVKVVVSPEAEGEILIAADDNIMDYVVVVRRGDKLHVSIDCDTEISHANATVTVPMTTSLRSLDASAGAAIVGESAFVAPEMQISASSAACVEAALKSTECTISASSGARVMVATLQAECDIMATSAARVDADMRGGECEVDASSSAKVVLTGKAEKGDFGASSAALIDGHEMEVKELEVSASSGAKADVRCSGSLDADASSGGKIIYRGNCEWKIDKSSGGTVCHKGE